MAIRYIVADDLDGTTTGVDSYLFSLDGVDYKIDLTQDNHERLRSALAPFIAAAQRLPKNGKPQPRPVTTAKPDRAANARVRAWWSQHWQAADLPEPRSHGVIPTRVLDAYHAAHPDPTT